MSAEHEQHLDDDAQNSLQEFLSAALEMQAQGITPPLSEICKSRPELQQLVASALTLSGKVPLLHSRARDHDPLIGAVLARRYRLEQAIGAGAMGVVYRGIDLELKRPIAVKVLRTGLFSGPEAEGRFEREAESMAALNHPAIVTVFDRGTTEDNLSYLVMELLEGSPLSAILQAATEQADRSGSPDRAEQTEVVRTATSPDAELEPTWLRQAVRWIAELAAGVEAAHEAGIYHRDIKPSNVFIRTDGHPVLIDFGIVARDEHATLSSRDNALGTPAYVAPEQLNDRPEPTPSLDVYGLAATLYHLITLQAPYDGSPSEVIARLIRHEPVPAYRIHANLPRDLQAILDCGMARNPKERYASVCDFAADLHAFLTHRPVAARPISSVGRIWRGLRRSREFKAVAAVVLIISIGTAGFFVDKKLGELRGEAWFRIFRTIPPAMSLARNPNALVIDDPSTRAELQTLLDDLVRHADHPLPSAALRAAFRLDQGDVAGAVADMESVQAVCSSKFVDALVERYRALEPDAQCALSLDVEGLPDPSTADDRYLSAFHVLRTGIKPATVAAALEVLGEPSETDNLAAHELRFLSLMNVAKRERDADKQDDLFRTTFIRVVRFEEVHGRTATTTQLRAGALMALMRYFEAAEVLREGLELAPRSNKLRNNLGFVLSLLDENLAAEEVLLEARELRPRNLRTWTNLALLKLQCQEFEAAQSYIDNAPFSDDLSGKVGRLQLQPKLNFERALIAWFGSDFETARKEAQSIVALGGELKKLGIRPSPYLQDVATAILKDEGESLFRRITTQLNQRPFNLTQLETVIDLLRPDMDRDDVDALRIYLTRLVRMLHSNRNMLTPWE